MIKGVKSLWKADLYQNNIYFKRRYIDNKCLLLPDSEGPYEAYVDKVMSQFLEIGGKGPVLVHCASGARAGK